MRPCTTSRPSPSKRHDEASAVSCSNTQGNSIIFRPVGMTSHLLAVSRDANAGFPAIRRIHVNHRRNLVAIDMHPASDPSTLLQVAIICEVTVKSKQLAISTCVDMVCGVDPHTDAEDIAANITSPVPIISCARRGKCLTLTFEGTTVPPEILLFKQR